MTGPEYLRAADIARLTGVSVRTALRWIVAGTLRSTKVGGARLVDREAIRELFSSAADICINDDDESEEHQDV